LSVILSNNNVDICCITESWLKSDVSSELINIDNYVSYRHDRADGHVGRGVLYYVRNGVDCRRLNELDDPNFEMIWLLFGASRMPRQVSHILIGVIYHPPGASDFKATTHIIDCISLNALMLYCAPTLMQELYC